MENTHRHGEMSSEATPNNIPSDGQVYDTIEIKREIDIKEEPESVLELIERETSTNQSIKTELQDHEEDVVDSIYCTVDLVKDEVKDEINTNVDDKPKLSPNTEPNDEAKENKRKQKHSPNERISKRKRNEKSSNLRDAKHNNTSKRTLKQHKCSSCEYVAKSRGK